MIHSEISEFTFPKTSLKVRRMGYGAMQLAGPHVFGPPKDREMAVRVLRTAIEMGVNHIDTSDFYGPHVTNQIIKEALHPYAKELVLVTKVGAVRGSDGSWNRALGKDELTKAVHDNLKNLGVESLDIVNLRVGSPLTTEDEVLLESYSVLVELKKKGLIRHLGVSNVTPKQFAEFHALHEVVCVQNQYNVIHRKDDAFLAQLAKLGIAYVPYFPLGGFTPLQSNVLESVAVMAEAKPMQVALAWLYQRSANILLIPGTSSLEHLHENMQAAKLKLSPDIIRQLDGLAVSSRS